jgi:hypothetical protein
MTMLLTDAGVHINAPFPAVLRPQRRADVIICFDARSLAGIGSARKEREERRTESGRAHVCVRDTKEKARESQGGEGRERESLRHGE